MFLLTFKTLFLLFFKWRNHQSKCHITQPHGHSKNTDKTFLVCKHTLTCAYHSNLLSETFSKPSLSRQPAMFSGPKTSTQKLYSLITHILQTIIFQEPACPQAPRSPPKLNSLFTHIFHTITFQEPACPQAPKISTKTKLSFHTHPLNYHLPGTATGVSSGPRTSTPDCGSIPPRSPMRSPPGGAAPLLPR